MIGPCRTAGVVTALALCSIWIGISGARAGQPEKAAIDFAGQIRPLLQERCFSCHGADKQKGELRLDRKAAGLKGSDNGPVIIPGKSAKSSLIQRVQATDHLRMPPRGKGDALTPGEIARLRQWIDQGAPWPEAAANDVRPAHWAQKPVVRPSVPAVADAVRSTNAIDRFIVAALAARGLEPSAEADRVTLIRRLKFDLLGLPPTPDEVEAFVADRSANAYEKLVDRYLASPHFGERWARHWLDVVRFAESSGFEMNLPRPNAWPYRDYVIRALNEDKPYDAFIRDQLAGDGRGEDAATGYLVAGAFDHVKGDPLLNAQQRADELHDLVSTTGSTFLGLTIGCARCHDHKFDPITQRDYYGMKAVFAGVQHGDRPLRRAGETREAEEIKRQLAGIEARLGPMATDPAARLTYLLDLRSTQAPVEPYQDGTDRGQRQDVGDTHRLPNLGRGCAVWTKPKDVDVQAWAPRVTGRFRIWLSWGCGREGFAADARYVLETGSQRVAIARVDQRKFADGTGTPAGQLLWSGFFDAGVHDFGPETRLVLRTGEAAATVTADLVLLQAADTDEKAAAPQPYFRGPVNHARNVERFAPVQARFVRMTIDETAQDVEPCIDELEVFTAAARPRNVALSSLGARATASGTLPGYEIHKLEHVNDGRYGNGRSWISSQRRRGWVQLELPAAERIDRVVWSRNRDGAGYSDRVPTRYRIEVAVEPGQWRTVATSDDRLPLGLPPGVPPLQYSLRGDERATYQKLVAERQTLRDRLAGLAPERLAYSGRFTDPEPTHRLHRGDVKEKRELVAPAAPAAFGAPVQLPPAAPEASRRLALANWIVDPKHPLTARVIVNRLWQHHFGAGIVATPSDFGVNGARPTHPELLDWLASELVAGDWRMKRIHRLMVLSSTYRQASTRHARGIAADAQSRLLWRFPPRRLEAEPLRDSILSVSGKLDLRMGGVGFDLFEPNSNYVRVYKPRKEFGPAEWRRMIYHNKPRMRLDDTFGAFDCPDAGQTTAQRQSSTTALQILNLLNSPFMLQQSAFFAERLRTEAGEDVSAQVRRGYRLAFQRSPDAAEAAASERFAREHGLAAFCRALFNANEFLYVF